MIGDSIAVASPEASERPPETKLTPGQWARKNLFSTPWNSAVSLLFGAGLVYLLVGVVGFFITADYEIIRVNLANFVVGRFPREQLWRPVLATGFLSGAVGLIAGVLTTRAEALALETGSTFRRSTPGDWMRRFWPLLLVVAVMLAFTTTVTPALVSLGVIGLGVATNYLGRLLPSSARRWSWSIPLLGLAAAYIVLSGFGGLDWNQWSGLHLNLFLTVAGIVFAFPLGLALALGRRSTLPTVRAISVTYIEFIRGVPLITLLFMAIFALGFLLPEELRPGNVTRALIAITLFEAAYIAEIVRGGLQGVPSGQVEAAQAVGLTPWKTMRLVVLPQALRHTIPAMVGQFISLFKDTTLVTIVGLTDLLRVSNQANAQPDFLGQGLHFVTLAFVGLIFWVGSYTMSREARRIERRLGVGER